MLLARAARRAASTAAAPTYEFILAARAGAKANVGLITLNRPKALNALSNAMVAEINAAARAFDADGAVGAIVITGSERAFAAGADIKEMAAVTFPAVYSRNMFAHWADLTRIAKPVIAAVNGFALGGGCELAMMADIILAGDGAVFGQPEVTIGTIPGCGGTQRLIRAVGKSKAMEMILTGDYKMGAAEAAAAGLVARVVPAAALLGEALALAGKIAERSQPVVALAKEATNAAAEMTLAEGVRFERRLFHATFATADQKEGMAAFVGKRAPVWKHE
jgi:enoyl-CoA hydratase/carnithine racemase